MHKDRKGIQEGRSAKEGRRGEGIECHCQYFGGRGERGQAEGAGGGGGAEAGGGFQDICVRRQTDILGIGGARGGPWSLSGASGLPMHFFTEDWRCGLKHVALNFCNLEVEVGIHCRGMSCFMQGTQS
jgi:hypothetical protein